MKRLGVLVATLAAAFPLVTLNAQAQATRVAPEAFYGTYQLTQANAGYCDEELRGWGTVMSNGGILHLRLGGTFFGRVNGGVDVVELMGERTVSETVTTANREIIAEWTTTRLSTGESTRYRNYAQLNANGQTLLVRTQMFYPDFTSENECIYRRTSNRR